MTKESGKNAYRTYCRERLVVSESAYKIDAEDSVIDKEKPKNKRFKRSINLFIK